MVGPASRPRARPPFAGMSATLLGGAARASFTERHRVTECQAHDVPPLILKNDRPGGGLLTGLASACRAGYSTRQRMLEAGPEWRTATRQYIAASNEAST